MNSPDGDPTELEIGDLVGELVVGCVKIRVTRNCARRDVYDLRAPAPLPPALQARLAETGTVRGGGALYVVDVPGVHSITVASASGRVVIMPRMAPERPAQRRSALAVAQIVDETFQSTD